MISLWDKTAKRPQFDRLDGDIKTDVLIIGGGMAGLLCALKLRRAGVDCILVEADRICHGVTMDTTAKITFQHGLIYSRLLKSYGYQTAQAYLNANKAALDSYTELCSNIDCDFKKCDSYVFSTADAKKIHAEAEALSKLGCSCDVVTDTDLPVSIKSAVRVEGQAQFHPLKFAYSIAKELPIFENTKVTELSDGGAKTNRGNIRAKKIIVATHFPFINKHGAYFLKMYQHRSYVIAIKGAKDVRGMYVDEKNDGLSFRNYKNLLLLGGGGHRTGKSGGGWFELEYIARENFPDCHIINRWATQDCITLDGIPYIGNYSKNTPDLYVATGFNKWGMTSSMAAATVLTDMITQNKSDYAHLFSPSRSMLHPQLVLNIGESILGLVTPTVPRCSHMGCALKYNPQEHSWDCSCHGSRFTHTGKLINNPATDDKKRI